MYNFFVDKNKAYDDGYLIDGTDYNHIINVLRMRENDRFLVSCDGKSDLCEIVSFDGESVNVKIIEADFCANELPTELYLFQGLPKSDKMELIIQKTVELGVSKIYPVEMKNCVVKLEEKKKLSKISRWQSIAESAAKQSKRNVIPQICEVISFDKMLEVSKELDLLIVPYENQKGMNSLKNVFKSVRSGMKIGVLIGPEGGFSEKEINKISSESAMLVSLGRRILRTETAAIVGISALMLYIESNLDGDCLD
ncbi:MAG: RsmE family RNA methyltransferase [Acutalibacteraceae bacterium]|nr:RsmE family RNA methyltransferase [Acutalibacteraceae bacterium]